MRDWRSFATRNSVCEIRRLSTLDTRIVKRQRATANFWYCDWVPFAYTWSTPPDLLLDMHVPRRTGNPAREDSDESSDSNSSRSRRCAELFYTAGGDATLDANGGLIADSLDSAVSLPNCSVGSFHVMNLRERPAGPILGWFHGDSTTARARTPNWFQIEYNGLVGWVSAHYAIVSGDCE